MRIRITAYGMLRELFGARTFDIELAAKAATVAELDEALVVRTPAYARAAATTAVAVGDELVRRGDVLTDGADVALLPPVSGG